MSHPVDVPMQLPNVMWAHSKERLFIVMRSIHVFNKCPSYRSEQALSFRVVCWRIEEPKI